MVADQDVPGSISTRYSRARMQDWVSILGTSCLAYGIWMTHC